MSKRSLLLGAAVLSLSLGSIARADIKYVEQAIETSADLLSLPDRSSTAINVRSCISCAARSLRITKRTRFVVAREQVTQKEFSKRLKAAGESSVGVFYDAKSMEATRIVIFGTSSSSN